MSTWQQHQAYLNQFRGGGTSRAADLYNKAVGKAEAVGLPDAEGKGGPSLLSRILSPIDYARGFVYATLTELSDAAGDDTFSAEDWKEKFDRARFEGEGFGSTEALSIDEDDGLLERAAKFTGSFAADVISDPVNWVTFGGATLSKVALTGLTKSVGKKVLADLPEVVATRTGKTLGDDVIDKLALDQLVKNKVADAPSVLKQLRSQPDKGSVAINELVSDRLGDVVLSGRVAGTGRTARSYLAETLRRAGVDEADKIAGDVIVKQTREVRGGLRLEAPFSRFGVDLTKGAGLGTDALGLGRIADAAISGRLAFRRAINRPGSLKRSFSGETGDLYGNMLYDMKTFGIDALYTPGKTTAGDVTKFVKARNASRIAADNLGFAFNTAAQAAQQALNDFGDEAVGRSILNAAFDGSQVALDGALRQVNPSDERVIRLVRAGQDARRAFRAEAEALGIDPDEAYVPRVFATEQAVDNILEDPEWNRRVSTDPAISRQAYREKIIEQVDDDDTRRLVLRDLSNMEINAERATRGKGRMFEDDMFIILAKRSEAARARVEAATLARELEGSGLIVKPKTATKTTLGEIAAEVDQSLRQVFNKSPQRAKRLAKEADETEASLKAARAKEAAAKVDGDAARKQLEQTRDQLRTALDQARKTRSKAKRQVVLAQQELSRLNKQYRELGRLEGREAEQLLRARKEARAKLKAAEKESMAARQTLAEAEADYFAATQAPITSTEGAKAAENLGKAKGRVLARDASTVSRQADLEAATTAAEDAAGGAGRYEFIAQDLEDMREEALRELGNNASLSDISDRLVRRHGEKLARQNNEIMSARYGTAAERRTKELVDRREQAARAAGERIEANLRADDLLATQLDTINNLLRTEDGWEQASTLIGELIDTYAAGGASKFDIETLRAAQKAVRKVPDVRKQRAAISALRNQGVTIITSEPGKEVPQALSGWLAGQGVRDAVIKLYAANTQTQGVAASLREYINPIMRIFRTYATVGRGPGYIVRNGIGASINNWLGGVQASRYPIARKIETTVHRVVKELNDDAIAGKVSPDNLIKELDTRLASALSWKVDGTDATGYQLARGFLDQGVQYNRATDALERSMYDSLAGRKASVAERRLTMNPSRETIVAQEQGIGVMRSTAERISTNQKLLDNQWVTLWANTAEREEFFVRMAAYAEGYARYGDEVSAGLFAKSLHFDYRDLTNFEKNLKFIVPFYTWTRYNLPLQIRAAINNPGSLQRLEAFSRNAALAFGSEEEGVLPDWVQERMGFMTPIGLPGGSNLAVMMETPQMDLYNWLTGSPAAQSLESINPLIKSFFEISSGKDVDTGADVDATQVVRNIIPPVGQAMRLAGLTSKDRERVVSSWLSFAGVPVATITPKQQEGILSRRTAEINARVRQVFAPYLAEGEEIDSDWLIEASRRFTPEQVITLVAQGYGRRGNLDPTKPKRERRRSTGPSAGTRAAQQLDPAAFLMSRYLG